MQRPRLSRSLLAFPIAMSVGLLACPAAEDAKGEDTKGAEDTKGEKDTLGEKKDGDEEAGEEKIDPKLADELKLDLTGPKPPETSAVLFAVDGALLPLACFDQQKGKLAGGSDCGKLVPNGEQAFLWSEFGKELDKIGEPKNALCEVADKPKSFAVGTVDDGRTFDWAIWPKSAHQSVTHIPKSTTEGAGTQLSEEESKAVLEAVIAKKGSAERGEFRSQQRAEADVDGDGTNELFISVVMAHPKDPDSQLHSGLWMAKGGDLANLQLIDSSNRKVDILYLRAVTDLDADGKSELWLGMAFDGGNGDAVYAPDGDGFKRLTKWTCGA